MEFRDLGCYEGRPPHPAVVSDAAWSPNGEWLALAGEDALVFDRLLGPEQILRWPAHPFELAWRPH